MRIDVRYISSLLSVFLKADKAHITLRDFETADVGIYTIDKEFDEKFIFHAQLLVENGLVSDEMLRSESLKTLGIDYSKTNVVVLVDKAFRLTQKGHDFANALDNKEVLERLKCELKNAPFQILFEGSQKLLGHYLTKRLDEIMA